jgi:hypothetical protein
MAFERAFNTNRPCIRPVETTYFLTAWRNTVGFHEERAVFKNDNTQDSEVIPAFWYHLGRLDLSELQRASGPVD